MKDWSTENYKILMEEIKDSRQEALSSNSSTTPKKPKQIKDN
jgi:hypothetical protein